MFRFAPSLSDDLHVGDLRIALLTYIKATQEKQKLSLRFSDLDQKENIAQKAQEIAELLSLFQISYHDSLYQSHNRKFHQQLATKLLMDKNAFSCFCPSDISDSNLPYDGTCESLDDATVLNNEAPFSVRIRRPHSAISYHDILKGDIEIGKKEIDSFMILHQDKTPTSDFATAIDDLLGDISMIIVDESQLPHTPKQVLVRDYLGYDKQIDYVHLPSISNAHDFSLTSLLEEGFLPSAISNYLISLGHQSAHEIFDLDEAITWFDLKDLSMQPQVFDIEKLKEINRAHIQKMPSLSLAKLFSYSSKDLGELAKIYTSEGSTINEIKPKVDAIFATKEPMEMIESYPALVEIAKEAPYFKDFDEFKEYLLSKSGLEEESFLSALRFMLTGAKQGPDLNDIYPHIKNYLGEIIK